MSQMIIASTSVSPPPTPVSHPEGGLPGTIGTRAAHAATTTFISGQPPHQIVAAAIDHITTFRDGSFQFDEDGAPYLTVVVEDQHGDMEDIVAWRVRQPGRWWLRHRNGDLLGWRWLRWARDEQVALALSRIGADSGELIDLFPGFGLGLALRFHPRFLHFPVDPSRASSTAGPDLRN